MQRKWFYQAPRVFYKMENARWKRALRGFEKLTMLNKPDSSENVFMSV